MFVDRPLRIDRVFLDWNRPLMRSAAEWLISHARVNGEIDLEERICVVPGRRAGRLLLMRLAEGAQAEGLVLRPPRIVTPSSLALACAERMPATSSDAEAVLVWMEALQGLEEGQRRVLAKEVPAGIRGWVRLAKVAMRLRRELSWEMVTFDDVRQTCERMERWGEAKRWEVLGNVESDVGERLRKLGLMDQDDAEQRVASSETRCRKIVLVGIVELSRRQRQVLDGWGDEVTALIHAPERCEGGFDPTGCPDPAWWSEQDIEVSDDAIHLANDAEDQAQQVLRCISSHGGRLSTDEFMVGVCDPGAVGALIAAGEWADVPMRSAAGVAIEQTGPWILGQLVVDWLNDRRFSTLSALMRHPDLERVLVAGGLTGVWETGLDEYATERLPRWVDDDSSAATGQPELIRTARDALDLLLRPLRNAQGQLDATALAWQKVLTEVYGGREQVEPRSLTAVEALLDAASIVTQVHARLARSHVNAGRDGETLWFVLQMAGGSQVAEPSEGRIEMAGWLELAPDDAPALILTSFNEGKVPSSSGSDAFLPDGLRRALGLPNEAQRHGRDAFLLQTILYSKQCVQFVVPRQDSLGQPLMPSRLLMQVDENRIGHRLRLLMAELPNLERRAIGLVSGDVGGIPMPELPEDMAVPESMRVTDFKAYLNCPRRYAMSRLLGLEASSDAAEEMSPPVFGNLIHRVLQRFGENETARDEMRPEHIESYLEDALDRLARSEFGRYPSTAIRVQLMRIRSRLRVFAARQAEMTKEGWRIRQVEVSLPDDAMLVIPGESPMRVTGRIDRIDQFGDQPRFRLMDYKTGEDGEEPGKTHRKGRKGAEEWIELQLPLYGRLGSGKLFHGQAELGYFLLPKSESDVRFAAGGWNELEVDSAIDKAIEIVRAVRRGEFAVNDESRGSFDPFRRILRVNVWSPDAGEGE